LASADRVGVEHSKQQQHFGSWSIAFRAPGPRVITATIGDRSLRAHALVEVSARSRGELDLRLLEVGRADLTDFMPRAPRHAVDDPSLGVPYLGRMPELLRSFDPVASADARVLVLGSMPGKASLLAVEYYAHPRNRFWDIIEALFGIERELPYAARLEQLAQEGVALWDVMQSCTRESSLDSDIIESSIVPNDFASLLAACPRLERIYFNGAKADQAYRKHVLPTLNPDHAARHLLRLPSTSPANAAMTPEAKLDAWRVIAEQSSVE
jgi:TDG/mug DNA glycosylase family protein